MKSTRRFFHLLSDMKTVREISAVEWFSILRKRHQAKTKLVATIYDNEICLDKGANHIFILKSQLETILEKDGNNT